MRKDMVLCGKIWFRAEDIFLRAEDTFLEKGGIPLLDSENRFRVPINRIGGCSIR